MKNITVPYGGGTLSAVLDESIPVQLIDLSAPVPPLTEDVVLQQALDHPIGTQPLEALAVPQDTVAIVVNDHTRPGPIALIVDEVVKRLERAGVPDKNIVFVVATGSHRASTQAELEQIVGKKYVGRFSVVMHNCKDKDSLIHVGDVQGLPIWLNRAVVNASFVITTGLIAPHHSAGFSGGRKSILPGVSGLDTLRIHHSLPIRPFEPAMGMIEGNRFHDVALEAAKLVSVRFIVNAVQDMHKQNIAFVAGDLELAHKRGVELCRDLNTVDIDALADVVVASPGGTPRDSDLYQAQKALAVAEVLVKPGGTMILCANAEQGIGEGLFVQWMKECSTPEEIIERYKKEGFNVGNNKAFMYARALTKGRVVIVSHNLDRAELAEMMLDWAPDLQTALNEACERRRPEQVIVLPRAVNMIPRVR